MTKEAFIAEIQRAIYAGVMNVKTVIANLTANGYHTTACVPQDQRQPFLDKCYYDCQKEIL